MRDWATDSASFETTALRAPQDEVLFFHQEFQRIQDAIAAERQVNGWRRAKKEALIRGEFFALRELGARYSPFDRPREEQEAACSRRS